MEHLETPIELGDTHTKVREEIAGADNKKPVIKNEYSISFTDAHSSFRGVSRSTLQNAIKPKKGNPNIRAIPRNGETMLHRGDFEAWRQKDKKPGRPRKQLPS